MFAGRSLWISHSSAGRKFFSTTTRFQNQLRNGSRQQSLTFSKSGHAKYQFKRKLPKSHGSKDTPVASGLSSGVYDAVTIAMMKSARSKRQMLDGPHRLTEGLPSEVLAYEANAILAKHRSKSNGDGESDAPTSDTSALGTTNRLKTPILSAQTQLELEIEQLSSTGDGLAYSKEHDHVFVVPFSVPGDKVLAKTFPQIPNDVYTMTDFLEVLRPSEKREGVTPGCKHFTKCSGCQLQMIPYSEQLLHKRSIVERAFQRFSNLDQSLIPPVGETIGSPLQYGYRTKLTPHHDSIHRGSSEDVPIGFNYKAGGRGKVLDIEQCPIGTPIVNEGMKVERQKIRDKKLTSGRGTTILLRESTRRTKLEFSENTSAPVDEDEGSNKERTTQYVAAPSKDATSDAAFYAVPLEEPLKTELTYPEPNKPELKLSYPAHEDTKTYVSDHKATSTEYVGDTIFENVANSFFQNNNSILPTCINYVRQQCQPPKSEEPTTTTTTTTNPEPPIKYLLDAYCGSGLFAVSLAPSFTSTLGIDVDIHGIKSARLNAQHNRLANAGFITADASTLFQDVPFPPEQSLVLMDPPRKGASLDFLQQLCQFGPRRVIYVSCNVHTQARDVGLLVQGFGGPWRYEIESLRGFDFFPQTGHVEGVCVLNRVRDAPGVGVET